MHFDLLVVGAGPAGLSAAIRFKQVRPTSTGHRPQATTDVSCCCPACIFLLPSDARLLSHCVARCVQLCKEQGQDLSVCVIEKGAEVGERKAGLAAHALRN